MSIETQNTNLKTQSKIFERTIQVIAEGDAIVPDIKPDIDKILTICGKINQNEEKISDNRVFFSGEAICSIMYIGKTGESGIYGMTATIPFDDVIPLPETDKNSTTSIFFNIESINHKIINDRKINIRCTITVKTETVLSEEISVLKNIENKNDIMIKEKNINICNCYERKKDIINLNESLSLPSSKPNIGIITECTGYIGDRDIKVFNGKVNIKGSLYLTVIYTSETVDSPIETVFFDIPFNIMEDCREASEDMIANAIMDIYQINCKTELDEDGEERKINADISINIFLSVYGNEEKDIAEDIYSISENIKPQFTTAEYPCFLMKNSTKSSFRDTITADKKYPDMLRIENVYGKMDITDKNYSDNKVTVEGVISGNILYTAQNDREPVAVIPYNIPFTQEIETKCNNEDVFYIINGYIDNISFDMLSENETELKITCVFDVLVFENCKSDFITDIINDESDFENNAGIIIYIVQKNDSLWNIAKRYHTTTEEILSLNTIENPEKLLVGEKLLILKTSKNKNI